MTFTAPPSAPSTADPNNFAARADAFLTWFATFQSELETNWPTLAAAIAAGDAVVGSSTAYGTSSTSNSIGTGSKTWTIETGRGFQLGQYVIIADTAAAATNYMLGRITAYNSGTGSLTVTVDTTAGSGTKTAWVVSLGAVAGRPAATAANARAGTSSTVDLTPLSLFQAMAFQTLTDAPTIAWDMANGPNAAVTIGASRIMGAPSNLQDGLPVALASTQGTGGGFTMTWNSVFDFGAAGAPTLSTAAGKVDFVFGVYRSVTGKIHASFWKAS